MIWDWRTVDLLHEVSLRASANKMDAHNLAVVLCPNLVKGSSPVKDVMICAIPRGPSMRGSSPSSNPSPSSSSENGTTLGQIVKLCVERYFEVFDEVRDPTEARHHHHHQHGQQVVEVEYNVPSHLQGPVSPSLHSHPSRNNAR